MTHYTANVLSSEDLGIVNTAVYVTRAASHYTANVVANVRISHTAVVHRAHNNARGIACNTANVADVDATKGGELRNIDRKRKIYVIKRKSGSNCDSVYLCGAYAVGNKAIVSACNTAYHSVADDLAAANTSDNAARKCISACNTANVAAADKTAEKGGVFNSSTVLANDTAHGLALTLGGDSTAYGKISDLSLCVKNGEKSHGRACRADLNTAYGVTCAVEFAREYGNGRYVLALKVYVSRQKKAFAL